MDSPNATGSTAVELPLPPPELRFMNEDDARFLEIGRNLVRHLVGLGLRHDDELIDVGCGYGRLAIALERELGFRGRYLGFDILPRHVEWCRTRLSALRPNLRFDHLDVRNDRYNPNGTIDADAATFPGSDASFRFCAVTSVFTHMYERDIRRYLGEIRRVLECGGRCLATFFLFEEDDVEAVTDPSLSMPMTHRLDEHARYFSDKDPLHAIAYEIEFVHEMVEDAGLRVESVRPGTWARRGDNDFQDHVIVYRP